ncbi:MAG: DUF4286 family protein [Tenacibaculum sp.]
MYIYNITINIDCSIRNQWLVWIKKHILEVLATGYFTSAKLTQVLVEQEAEGFTYAVQYIAKTRADLNNYYKQYSAELRKQGTEKFADKMMTFRTELKLIDEFYPAVIKN